ncbi:MAG: class I SAM-dependent methyltransferase [Lentisphaeria bacterium]|nr:class I SAM-dependent methyltransferase [Lentisphaeria bacterium]
MAGADEQTGGDCYELLDAGDGRKLERFGAYVLERPCAQAVWRPRLPRERWNAADAAFHREDGSGWSVRTRVPETWIAVVGGLKLELSLTDFGHVGAFPEHARVGRWMKECRFCETGGESQVSVLNLFAYSGGATLAAASLGWRVCHLDASRKMVAWARRNADLNALGDAPVRWITDDAQKFLGREQRRGTHYDGIILDPPSFGRGKRQELFKIDDHLLDILDACRSVLSQQPKFVFLSCHTPGYTPLVLRHLLGQSMTGLGGSIETGEMVLEGSGGALPVPSGTFAVWSI